MTILRKLILLIGTTLLAASALGEDGRLNLFIWSEYIEPGVVADFEKKFQCKVTIDLYEDDAAMMAKLQAGGASLYDLVVPPDHKVRALIRLNLLAPLRHANIPNLRNLEERFRNPPYDRGNVFTVAYQWGTLGLYVRTTPGQELPQTWGLVFDPKLQPGPFVLIDSPRDLISAALKYKGWSMSSTDPQQLKAVRDLILAAKKRCVGFEGSVGAKNQVLGKMARAAMVYSGEAARGIAEDQETAYILPREGSQLWQDNLAVLAQAPHRDLAERFINYVLEPEVGARISNFTQFATPNRAAKPFIRPADLNNPVIYPPPDLMAKLEFLNELGPASRLYDEVWTQIKAK
jgi:spermidine/putrescine transport system substrate-binding protein